MSAAVSESLSLPEGHYPPPWEWLGSFAPLHAPATPVAKPGPYGECWTNAWLAAQRMHRKVRYCEGLAWLDGEGWVDLGNGNAILRGRHYPHAWLLDVRTGQTWEPTAGYEDAHRVGVPLAHHVVARTFEPLLARMHALAPTLEVPPLASWLELTWVARDYGAITEAVEQGAR